MKHLKYENELDFGQWAKHLITIAWTFVAAIFFAELLVYFILLFRGELEAPMQDAWRIFIAPTLANVANGAITTAISLPLMKKGQYALQAYVYLTSVIIMAGIISWMHGEVLMVQASFCIPMLLSLSYVDYKPCHYATWTSLGAYILYTVLVALVDSPRHPMPGVGDFVTIVVIMSTTSWVVAMVFRHQSDLIKSLVDSRMQARQDSLTGLYNHATFYEQLDKRIQRYNTQGTPFSLIIMDIDSFKEVNDVHGHAVGDEVLVSLVEAIRERLGEGDEAFRYGGEEFAVLTGQSAEQTKRMADDIRTRFSSVMRKGAHHFRVTVSAGVCLYDGERFGARREFFAAADEALYHAKRTGKDKVVVWEESLRGQ